MTEVTLFRTYPIENNILNLDGGFHITRFEFPVELGSFTVYYDRGTLEKLADSVNGVVDFTNNRRIPFSFKELYKMLIYDKEFCYIHNCVDRIRIHFQSPYTFPIKNIKGDVVSNLSIYHKNEINRYGGLVWVRDFDEVYYDGCSAYLQSTDIDKYRYFKDRYTMIDETRNNLLQNIDMVEDIKNYILKYYLSYF